MQRRQFLSATAALGAFGALSAPRLGLGAENKLLRFIPESDATVLDPMWTTATVTRNHGYLVFDTLYGQDESYAMQPQMVEGHVVENDGRLWTLTLREGMRFHDGEPVRAIDAVTSIRRIAARDAFAAALMAATDDLSVFDDRRFRFRLKKPFPLLPNALGKTGTSMPAIMPERLAKTDPFVRVDEMVGSGPFRYKASEHVAGSLAVYERFDGYVPRAGGTPSFTAGPKRAHFDRIEWRVIPDASTAANAMMNGEADWWQQPTADLMPLLKGNRSLKSSMLDPSGNMAIMRFNTLHPPFDNPAIRRALLGGVSQTDVMMAIAGEDRSMWKDDVGVFSPGTPFANDAGMEVLTSPRDMDKVKRDLAAAGYKGEAVALLVATDYPDQNAAGLVVADLLRRAGMKLDLQSTDWGTVVQRRAKKDPPAQGGWNAFITNLTGTNNFDPASHLGLRGNGDKAWFGWPNAPKLEELRQQWFDAPNEAEQKRICREIQADFMREPTYLPLGAYYPQTVFSAKLTGMRSGLPQFYDIRWA